MDPLRNLIYVRGQVPGHKGNYVYVRDALYKDNPNAPFPTHIGNIRMWCLGTLLDICCLGALPEIRVAEPDKDPYHLYQKGKL